MKIDQLKLHQFKRFEQATFHFHSTFTVLIGDNATGKTSILDALSVLLGTYLMRSKIQYGRQGLQKDEARWVMQEQSGDYFAEPQADTYIQATGHLHAQSITWRRNLGDRGRAAKAVIAQGKQDRLEVSKGQNVDLPVMLYYGSNRLWSKHRNVNVGKPESRLVGFRHCLEPKSDQHLFEKWFKRLELAALQQRRTLAALEIVRNSVIMCLENVDAFYFDVASDRLMVGFDNGEQMPFHFLSDGYRNMIGMIADMAHRMFRLNPHFEDKVTQKSKGVVLIDEIDLHLHPKWQRRVVGDLRRAFPNIQFIATTHSPFILQSLEPGQVIDLNLPLDQTNHLQPLQDEAMPGPVHDFSDKSIEDIAERVMHVEIPQRSLRYQQMHEAAKAYYRLLKQGEAADQPTKMALQQQMDALVAPFSDQIAYHAFLEMERLAAGFVPLDEEQV